MVMNMKNTMQGCVFRVHLVGAGEDRLQTWKPCPGGVVSIFSAQGLPVTYIVRRNTLKNFVGGHTLALPMPPCLPPLPALLYSITFT